ncbi:MAG: hypothetical protein ABI769_07655 [Pseudomonadota bacterium]
MRAPRSKSLLAFVSRHAARYLLSPVQRRRPDLQCLRSPVWTVSQLFRQYHFGLSLAVTRGRATGVDRPGVREWRRDVARVFVAAPAVASVPRQARVTELLVRRFESSLEVLKRHERVVTTAAARQEPESVLAKPAAAALALAPRALAEPRLPALPLARRAPAAEMPATQAPAASESARGSTPALHAQARAVRITPMADHEIERVAERVIGSIDRRLIAQRERLGNH